MLYLPLNKMKRETHGLRLIQPTILLLPQSVVVCFLLLLSGFFFFNALVLDKTKASASVQLAKAVFRLSGHSAQGRFPAPQRSNCSCFPITADSVIPAVT